eukprot:355898_1
MKFDAFSEICKLEIGTQIIFKRSQKSHAPDYISIPTLHQTDSECYWYCLCAWSTTDQVVDIPVHILLVEDRDDEYEQWLLVQDVSYLQSVLRICYEYLKTYSAHKIEKTKLKYSKKGAKRAHMHVFKQIISD